MTVKTGMRPFFAVAIKLSAAVITVTSPPIHNASAPRATSAPAASATPEELSTVDSISSMPISAHTLRASFTCASEFASAAFQTTPTFLSSGFISRAIWKAWGIGCIVPKPARCAGCSSGFALLTPTPAMDGSLTSAKTCFVPPALFAFATAWSDTVLIVMSKS